MHLYKEFGSKSFETRCWNEAAKYWNNLSKGTTAENLDQGEAKLRRMNSWQTCSSFLLCFSQIFLKLRTVTNCPSKMRLIRIVGPLYSIIWCKGFMKFYYNTYLSMLGIFGSFRFDKESRERSHRSPIVRWLISVSSICMIWVFPIHSTSIKKIRNHP